MKRVNVISLYCCFLLFPGLSWAEYIHGTVVSVHDGDTVTVEAAGVRHKVRLAGIDSPERKSARWPEQPYALAAGDFLRGELLGKPVTVSWTKRDRYGRPVGKVYYRRIDQNWRMVAAGFAWHYKTYQSEQSPRDRKRYATAEAAARAARAGLWAAPSHVPPWDWRRGLTATAVPQ